MINGLPRQWIAALALVLSGLCGCAVNQARDVQTYRDVLDGAHAAAEVSFHPDGPLTLREALRLANAHNEQLAIAGENYLQALIDKDRAFAAFLPTIGFAATFMSQGKTDFAADNPLIAAFEPPHATDALLGARMNVHPFRDAPAMQAAGAASRAQRALLLDRQAIVLLDVARTYFQVLRSEKQVTLLGASIETDERRVSDMRIRLQAGAGRPADLSLTEAQLAKTRNMLIQARDDVKNGRAMLAFLIGAPEVAGPLGDDLEIPPIAQQFDPLLHLADGRRQDLIAAQEQVQAAAAALEAAWGQYFPSVSLDLTRYLSRETFPTDLNWASIIQLNVPLFSAGLIHADVRTAYSRLRQAQLYESSVRRQVLKDIRVAVENLRTDDQQIRNLAIQVQAARDGADQAKAEFDAGVGTNLQFLIARSRLLSAELDLATARYNRSIDYLIVLRATGSLNPDVSASLPSDQGAVSESAS
ncbi:TolC family protein [Desulfatirhabdium butyrativorans]|uniref:TolC family protein n=1 Tax=Desulfatirhabdium butyrativorans TaxID=340467 RepID=UPI0004043644|nr:TolC family protein [Desulfatirhabdium butyrativorans]